MVIRLISKELFINIANDKPEEYKSDILFGDVFEDQKKIKDLLFKFNSIYKIEELQNLDVDNLTIHIIYKNENEFYGRISDSHKVIYVHVSEN